MPTNLPCMGMIEIGLTKHSNVNVHWSSPIFFKKIIVEHKNEHYHKGFCSFCKSSILVMGVGNVYRFTWDRWVQVPLCIFKCIKEFFWSFWPIQFLNGYIFSFLNLLLQFKWPWIFNWKLYNIFANFKNNEPLF